MGEEDNQDGNSKEQGKGDKNSEQNYREEGDNTEIDFPKIYERQIPAHLKQALKMQTEAYQKFEPIIKAQTQLIDSLQPALQAFDRFEEITKPITDMMKGFEKISVPLQNINWDLIDKAIAEKIKETVKELKCFEEEFWCLDADILDAFDEEKITNESLVQYVQENLDEYVEELMQEPMFSIHKSLLWETFEAYKSGFYKLCTYSLFSIFEHLISSWYVGNIKKEEILVHAKPNVRRRLEKIEPFTKNAEEQREFLKVFAQAVFRIHQKTFTKIPGEINRELNRNSIAHGFHDYDSIGQTDILKLFQLLKSSLVLRMVEKEDFDDEN
ncbi:UNVERIFIED_CONTAM: hypothetical protein N8J90_01070 [Halobacillus marinus]